MNNDVDDDKDITVNIVTLIIRKMRMISVKSILIIDKWLTEYPLAEDVSHLPLSFSPHLLDRIFQTQEGKVLKMQFIIMTVITITIRVNNGKYWNNFSDMIIPLHAQ